MVKLVWYLRKLCSWTSTKKEVEGGNFVEGWGVDRYCLRNLCISWHQFLPSRCAARIDFIRVC